MWIFTNRAMLSIVQDRRNRKRLLVRARVKGDIESVFPNARVFEMEDADYRFRAFVLRKQVAEVMRQQIMGINYSNFKDSIPKDDEERHTVYSRVWSVLMNWQDRLYGSSWLNYLTQRYGIVEHVETTKEEIDDMLAFSGFDVVEDDDDDTFLDKEYARVQKALLE